MKPFKTLDEAEEWMDQNADGEISVYVACTSARCNITFYREATRATLDWTAESWEQYLKTHLPTWPDYKQK